MKLCFTVVGRGTDLWQCTLIVLPHWNTRLPVPWACYPNQLHYPDTEATSPCPILIMPRARLGRDKYQVIGLTRLGFKNCRLRTRTRSRRTGGGCSTHSATQTGVEWQCVCMGCSNRCIVACAHLGNGTSRRTVTLEAPLLRTNDPVRYEAVLHSCWKSLMGGSETVSTHGDFILLSQWTSGCQQNDLLSHSVSLSWNGANQYLPYPNNTERRYY